MPIDVKTTTAEAKPVKVDEKNGKDVYCSCCVNHEELKAAMIRGSAFELRTLLPQWFASLGAKEILSHAQSESDGNLTVSVTYR